MNLLKKMSFFILPRSLDEDMKRREFILNILLGVIIALTAIGCILVLDDLISFSQDNKEYEGISFFYIFSLLIFFTIDFLLSRRGYIKLSSYILIFALFIPTVFSMYYWGFELQMILLTFALIIVISGILIGTKFSIETTILICLLILSESILRELDIHKPNSEWHKEIAGYSDAIIFIAILSIISLLSWLSNREIEKSLRRARRSEKALKRERDSLDIKVKERTKELKEAQLSRMMELERFAEFGRMASGIFHDLSNPLTTVSISLSQAKKPNKKLDQAEGHIQRAVTATKKMQEFMSTVRKQIKQSSNLKPFSLNEEIEQVLNIAEYKARKEKVDLEFKAKKNVKIKGDPLKFYQIASNLVFNAIDAYGKVSDSQDKKVIISLRRQRNNIIFTVKDFGCGITEDILDNIFNPFFTTKESSEGIGLGLSTTKKIIKDDFQGEIKVKSVVSKGTIFRVKLPLKNKK